MGLRLEQFWSTHHSIGLELEQFWSTRHSMGLALERFWSTHHSMGLESLRSDWEGTKLNEPSLRLFNIQDYNYCILLMTSHLVPVHFD